MLKVQSAKRMTIYYVIMATGKIAVSPGSEAERSSGGALKNPFVGNVSKFIPLPSGHKGDVKKGRLLFDACFEGGEQLAQPRPSFWS